MKLGQRILFIICICLLVSLLPGAKPHAQQVVRAAAAANLVPNSGFEEIQGDGLAAWRLLELNPPAVITAAGVAAPRGVVVRVSQDASGGHYLKMEGQSRPDQDYTAVASPQIRLQPGFNYEISFRYRAHGLQPESSDRTKYAAINLDLSFDNRQGRVGGIRIRSTTDSDDWVHLSKTFTVPPGTETSTIRLQLAVTYPNTQASVDWDDVSIMPEDQALSNASFETADANGQPISWFPVGTAKLAWQHDVVHSGRSAVSVSDAPDGLFSGWATQVPVRSDRSYVLSGYVRGGDNLSPNGFIGGGALEAQFLDGQGQPLGKPLVSRAVPARTDWTQVSTPPGAPPAGAVAVRLTAGLEYCSGTASFDDLSLSSDVVVARSAVRVIRTLLRPSAAVQYAPNLLANGDVEEGVNGKPAHWTYIGKSAPDWTPQELDRFHASDLAPFEIGRGQGDWSHDITYAGKGALLNTSIDPPLAQGNQHHGQRPVDGYWLSDPMPCTAGSRYMASAWMRFGVNISQTWYGPLELQFFDGGGNQLPTKVLTRSGLGEAPAGVWSFWATLPWVAPAEAVSMRLRFGQELDASRGGFGRTYADNLAVWRMPADVPAPNYSTLALNTQGYQAWFRQAIQTVKPPYLPSPADASEYESAWGVMENTVPGNLYQSTETPVHTVVRFLNLLGEDRKVSLVATSYDVAGHAGEPVTVPDIDVPAYSDAKFAVTLPPTGHYGAFYVDLEAREGKAVVGHAAGRYAVLPTLDRPRTAANIWGVTPLVPIEADGKPFEGELAHMLKTAGFGLAWVRMRYGATPDQLTTAINQTLKVVDWYRAIGIKCVVQLYPNVNRPVDPSVYQAAGQMIGTAFDGKVAALGNWGIEVANSASPYRGGGQNRYSDEDYDTILAAQYTGIKSAAPNLPVLIGNIATDLDAKTVQRISQGVSAGKFDGAIINAYLGPLAVAQNTLRALDSSGGAQKTLWLEENADQRSPFEGDARRQGEAQGPANMARSWLTLAAKLTPRLKAITMWGFVTPDNEDIMMVTPNLQPRPQYAAFAVMTDALADAHFTADHSQADLTLLEWKRDDGPLLVTWGNSGVRTLTLQASAGQVTEMDLYGNRTVLKAAGGTVAVKVGTTPIYLFGGGQMQAAGQ